MDSLAMIVPRRSPAVRSAMLYRGRGVRVNGLGFLLTPAQQAFYGAAGTLNQVQGFQGGTSTDGSNYSYSAAANPLLTPELSTTDLTGVQVTQQTAPQATQSAAQKFAAALGGSVATIATPWSSTTPTYGVRLPDGTVVDATAIANILGNDAAFPSEAVKSGEIAKLIGAQYQPGIAAGLVTGSRVNVSPGPTPAIAAPIYVSTSQTPDPAQAPSPSWFAPSSPASSGGGIRLRPVSETHTAADTVSVDGASWFTRSMFAGIPNWMLLAGFGVGAFAFMGNRS